MPSRKAFIPERQRKKVDSIFALMFEAVAMQGGGEIE
jgi:hypothetical protein